MGVQAEWEGDVKGDKRSIEEPRKLVLAVVSLCHPESKEKITPITSAGGQNPSYHDDVASFDWPSAEGQE